MVPATRAAVVVGLAVLEVAAVFPVYSRFQAVPEEEALPVEARGREALLIYRAGSMAIVVLGVRVETAAMAVLGEVFIQTDQLPVGAEEEAGVIEKEDLDLVTAEMEQEEKLLFHGNCYEK